MINKSFIKITSSWGGYIYNLFLKNSLEVDDNYKESLEILSEITNLYASFVCEK